jgi:hypothetical protein
MKSRAVDPLTVIANLAAFSACACLAFARNINALFYHYGGSYRLVDARDQLNFGKPMLTGAGAALIRVDGVLTGIVFEHDLDAMLSFRIGPLHNPLRRWQDYQDLRAMLH